MCVVDFEKISMILISIIIPVYNVEKYLRRCVKSLLEQNWKNVEIILVDDGSKDGSGVLCDELANEDSRIRVIHQENQGASLARRNGIAAAQGEYLAFVDSDDYVEPQYLQAMYDAIIRENADVAACGFVMHKEGENVPIIGAIHSVSLRQDEVMEKFFKYQFWGFCGGLYRHDAFEKLYFPEATVNEDYVVKLQLFYKIEKMAYVPVPLYHYIAHENSLSHQKLTKRAFEEFDNKMWAYEYCKKNYKHYAKHAEAQVAETCIKLLSKLRANGSVTDFDEYKREIIKFIRTNLFSLMFNRHLFWKYKILLMK